MKILDWLRGGKKPAPAHIPPPPTDWEPEPEPEILAHRNVNGEEAQRLVEAGEVHVLDVRTPGEHVLSRIPGSQLVPVNELEDSCESVLKTGKPVLVYCEHGIRSLVACQFLRRDGYAEEQVINLDNGIVAWRGPREGNAHTAAPGT